MVGYIYILTSPNGKSYIGQTYNKKGLSARWQNGYGYDRNTIIRRAIDKYGWSNFTHDILYKVENNNPDILIRILNRLEEYEIVNQNTLTPNGYNSVSGGLNSIISDATKSNMSAAARKRYLNGEVIWNKGLAKELQPRYGKRQTSRQRDAARIAIKKSIELGKITGHKIGEFKHSEETKKKISAAQKNYSDEKKLAIYEKRNKTMIERYGTKSLGAKNTLGKKWFTNGTNSVLTVSCPVGYRRGRTIPHEVRIKISNSVSKLHKSGVYKRDRTDFILDKYKNKE